MVSYQALFEPEGDSIVVTFPDIGHGATCGANEAEATEMATDFLETVIGELIRRGEEIPAAKRRTGKKYRMIELPALAAAKTMLYQAFLASGVSKSELARRLGIPKTNVDRLFNLKHSSRIEHLEAAAAALGGKLTIAIGVAA